VIKMDKDRLAKNVMGGPDIKVAAGIRAMDKDLDPAKIWNDAIAKGDVQGAHVIAVADFLFEAGEFKHAAELLKASLRHGIVARPGRLRRSRSRWNRAEAIRRRFAAPACRALRLIPPTPAAS